MRSKPTWEDVPGMICEILAILKSAEQPSAPQAHEPESTESQTGPAQTDREAARASILHINRANPDRRQEVKSIIAQYTPTGDGRFDDVPDAKIADLLAHLEGAFNVAA